jgi:hypothetical protein
MNYIKPEQIKAYVEQNPQGIAGMSEDLATMVNHFAELIVRECGILADQYQFEKKNPNPLATERLPLLPSDFIYEHFGVDG